MSGLDEILQNGRFLIAAMIDPRPRETVKDLVAALDQALIEMASAIDTGNKIAERLSAAERERDELRHAVTLALEYWISDHPNDTGDAIDAYNKIRAALKNAGGDQG